MKVLCVLALCALAFGVAGCGGGGPLSAADYRAALAKISKEADAAHLKVQRAELSAKSVDEFVSVLRSFAGTEDHIGDEVAKLNAPADAKAANALLVKGEHDDADTIRSLLPKLSGFNTVTEVIAYLRTIPQPKGGREQDDALSKLSELGYVD